MRSQYYLTPKQREIVQHLKRGWTLKVNKGTQTRGRTAFLVRRSLANGNESPYEVSPRVVKKLESLGVIQVAESVDSNTYIVGFSRYELSPERKVVPISRLQTWKSLYDTQVQLVKLARDALTAGDFRKAAESTIRAWEIQAEIEELKTATSPLKKEVSK